MFNFHIAMSNAYRKYYHFVESLYFKSLGQPHTDTCVVSFYKCILWIQMETLVSTPEGSLMPPRSQ